MEKTRAGGTRGRTPQQTGGGKGSRWFLQGVEGRQASEAGAAAYLVGEGWHHKSQGARNVELGKGGRG